MKIIAVGVDIDTNTSGDQLQEIFHKTESALGEIYGVPKTINHLKSGSIWNEPQDWMMGMLKKDRDLVLFWDSGAKINLEHMVGVMLKAEALNSHKGFIRVTYEFVGWNELADEIQKKKDSVF